MSPLVLLHGLAPLVVFVLVNHFAKDLRKAVYAACAVGLAEFFGWFAVSGEVEWISLIAVGVIGGCGYVAIRTGDPFWFKTQPAFMALIIGLWIARFQFFTDGLAYIIADLTDGVLPETWVMKIKDPAFLKMYNFMITSSLVAFPMYMGLVIYAAKRWSDAAWLAVRMVSMYPLYFGVAIISAILYPLLGGELPK